jgi:hypothetical protein
VRVCLSTRPLRTCGSWQLVHTRAGKNFDLAATLIRSRSSPWVFFEFVSCAFAIAGLKARCLAGPHVRICLLRPIVAGRTKQHASYAGADYLPAGCGGVREFGPFLVSYRAIVV